jgi:hypothetical protein
MISFRAFIRISAVLAAIMTAGVTPAGDGVVRMSDRSANPAQTASGIQPISHSPSARYGATGVVKLAGPPQYGMVSCAHQSAGCGCRPNQCGTGCDQGCNPGKCQTGGCYTPIDCNSCFSGTDASGMPACWCSKCQHSPCQCRGAKKTCWFAGSVDSGTCSPCRDFWHGQSMSFRNKNARLSNHLFGWMIPSGCCGQGCPPVGKYGITYADQPDYFDPRDTHMYGAQGYGMPMAVPLAPNVYQSYNYSSGIPASRITQIGTYNPATSAQPLYHQTW